MSNKKLKTRKSIKSRFKITKNGKVLRRPSGLDHLKRNKSKRTKRKGRSKWIEVPKPQAKLIKKMLKY